MKRSQWWIGIGVIAAFAAGIAWARYSGTTQGGVAIVDLEEVARELGRDKEMVAALQAHRGALSQQLVSAQQQVNQELTNLRAKLGPAPTQDQTRDLQSTAAKYQQQLAQMQNQATVQLNEQGKKVLNDFRDSARPVAIEVASAKGLTTVMTKDDAVVFAFDSAVDITAEVTARMKAMQPAANNSSPESADQPSQAVATQTASTSDIIPASATAPAK